MLLWVYGNKVTTAAVWHKVSNNGVPSCVLPGDVTLPWVCGNKVTTAAAWHKVSNNGVYFLMCYRLQQRWRRDWYWDDLFLLRICCPSSICIFMYIKQLDRVHWSSLQAWGPDPYKSGRKVGARGARRWMVTITWGWGGPCHYWKYWCIR